MAVKSETEAVNLLYSAPGLAAWVDVLFQSGRLGLKALIHGSAGTKLTLNQDFKHDKEDYVSQNTLILVFMKLNMLNEAKLVVWLFVFC
jgi:hypothetical protein